MDHITISQSTDWSSQPWVRRTNLLTMLYLLNYYKSPRITVQSSRLMTASYLFRPISVTECRRNSEHEIPHEDPNARPGWPDPCPYTHPHLYVFLLPGTYYRATLSSVVGTPLLSTRHSWLAYLLYVDADRCHSRPSQSGGLQILLRCSHRWASDDSHIICDHQSSAR